MVRNCWVGVLELVPSGSAEDSHTASLMGDWFEKGPVEAGTSEMVVWQFKDFGGGGGGAPGV